MRIVAGSLGGRRIEGPTSEHRPTMDKVRGAIFNSIASRRTLEGSAVVDLFAGSGALGIEALSRGAASATFVEQSRSNADLIGRNLAGLDLRGEVKVQDVFAFLRSSSQFFDLAFVDPPYAFDKWSELLDNVHAELLVCESNRPVELREGWVLVRAKRYGGTEVTMFERDASQASGSRETGES